MSSIDDQEIDLQPLIGGVADPDAVTEWVEQLTPEQLACRTHLGHSWHPFDAFHDGNGDIVSVIRCSRCKNKKTRKFSRRTRRPAKSPAYEYQEGYRAPAGTGHLNSDARGALAWHSLELQVTKSEAKKKAAAKSSGGKAKTAASMAVTRKAKKG